MSVAEQSLASDAITYEDLYTRWEQNNWEAMSIDFSEDRNGWAALNEIQQKSALWLYSMFFFGEDSVTDNLSPYIDAAPKEEQKYFLATQQVDEARHAIFFHRFFKEVIEAGDTVAATLAFTESQLNWGYRKVFERLDRMGEELTRDRSLPKFAQAITLYHLVVEATLAQPGQHFIEDFFANEGSMPGFSQGMKNVSRDEQRHIGFGVKVLSDLFRESDECRQASVELLREVMPWTSGVFVPPGWDERYTTEYGFTPEEIYSFGFKSVEAKWRAIGYPIDEMPPDVFPLDMSLPVETRAEQMIKLSKAGLIGQPPENPDSSPELQQLFFDTVARSARTESNSFGQAERPGNGNGNGNGASNGSDPYRGAVPARKGLGPILARLASGGGPFTVQWRFSDADPWHVVVDNGSTRAIAGEAPNADVTMESRWQDFIAVSGGHINPTRAMLDGRLKLSGGPVNLLRFRSLFPTG